MKTLITLMVPMLLFSSVGYCAGSGGGPNPGQLDPAEEATLVYMREEEKLARDVYTKLDQSWSEAVFENISESEQRHMDTLLGKLEFFGIEDPVTNDATGVFTDPVLGEMYDDLVSRGMTSLLEAYHAGAYVEEMDIRDLGLAIAETDESPLIKAYGNLQSASRNHLRAFVGHIESMDVDYQAQVLSQEEVDDIVGDLAVTPGKGFSINRGLNDAWYYPATNGQGFYITVYPDCGIIFLGWFTYETELPDESSPAALGDSSHRWLTAQGAYAGAQAELQLHLSSGGTFDSETSVVEHDPYGSVLLQFEDCSSGSVVYDIPSLGLSGIIPIQRIVPDNIAHCENLAEAQQ
jgi:hypothetical protein